jgi:hypothetical protein
MRDFQARRSLPGATKFSPEIQDRFATDIIKLCGRNAGRLAGRWASLQSLSADAIYAAYDREGNMKPQPDFPTSSPDPKDFMSALLAWIQRTGATVSAGDDGADSPVLKMGDAGCYLPPQFAEEVTEACR